MMTKRRLHPIAMATGVGRELKHALLPLLVVVVAGSRGDFSWRDLVMPLLVFAYTIVAGVLSWVRFKYGWDGQTLEVEEGLFVRKKRTIPFERIQGISTAEGIWQRLAGVVKVQIETAGSGPGEAEVVLAAVSREEVRRLQREIERAKEQAEASHLQNERENQPLPPPLFTLSVKEVWLAAVTSGGAFGVVAAVWAFLSQLGDLIPYEALFRNVQATWNGHGRWYIGAAGLVALLAAYGVAIGQNMIRFASFAVRRQEDTIVITRGWLERQTVSVPIGRVQGVMIHESWLRRLFGYATVSLIHAGGALDGGPIGDVVLCPLVKKERVSSIVHACLPEYDLGVALRPLPKRAQLRYMLRPLYWLTAPLALAAYIERPWGAGLLFALPLALWIGARRYQAAGWSLSSGQLTLRSGWFRRTTTYMVKRRLQAVEVSATWWQQRKRLATISAAVMPLGTRVRVVDVDEEDAALIYRWLQGDGRNQA
ncbi:PH domain-containing protein [Geobacillus subterraneus]|uniref:PH domain-containing protein n=1 Tax=Geobacillus subterraneus TaxID=129338 RepID=UPI001615910D